MQIELSAEPQEQFNAEPPPPPKVVKLLRQHPRFQEIHFDVIEGRLRAEQIAKKYDLKTKANNFAVNSILRYRQFLDERFAPLFAKANELKQEALREEFLEKHRKVAELAEGDHAAAMKYKKKNFGAARDFLYLMANSASEIGKASGIGMTQVAPAKVTTNNVKVLMALPKAQPNQAPVRVIEASKSA